MTLEHTSANFLSSVEGTHKTDADVQPGDLVVVDRSLDTRDNALVVAALNGKLTVLRVQQVNNQIQTFSRPLAG